MLHVAHPVPATWRGGTIPAIAARLQLRERVTRLYQRISEGVLPAIRAQLGAHWTAIIHKARSLTQTPSAIERVGEQLIALHAVGTPAHLLREIPAELEAVVDELTLGHVRDTDVLHAVEVAIIVEAKENEAEALLLCRGDRELTEGDLSRLIEAKAAEIAADRDVMAKCQRRLAVRRAERRGIAIVRGGSR